MAARQLWRQCAARRHRLSYEAVRRRSPLNTLALANRGRGGWPRRGAPLSSGPASPGDGTEPASSSTTTTTTTTTTTASARETSSSSPPSSTETAPPGGGGGPPEDEEKEEERPSRLEMAVERLVLSRLEQLAREAAALVSSEAKASATTNRDSENDGAKREQPEPGVPVDILRHPWWRLEERRSRRPTVLGHATSFFAGWLARWAGLLEDGRFGEGATRALERLHEAMAEGDVDALRACCDAPLAEELEAALSELGASRLSIAHGCLVARPPRIAWWRVVIGVERREALWDDAVGGDNNDNDQQQQQHEETQTRGDESSAPSSSSSSEEEEGTHERPHRLKGFAPRLVRQDWCAFDARRVGGVLVVLPERQFAPLEKAVAEGSAWAMYHAVADAMDKHTVSVQAVVDFPWVREALVAWKPNATKAEAEAEAKAKAGDDEQTDLSDELRGAPGDASSGTSSSSKSQDSSAQDLPNSGDAFWRGSTDGFVFTSRQLIFESPAFRRGSAVDAPEWTLVDVDNITDGGGPYWKRVISLPDYAPED